MTDRFSVLESGSLPFDRNAFRRAVLNDNIHPHTSRLMDGKTLLNNAHHLTTFLRISLDELRNELAKILHTAVYPYIDLEGGMDKLVLDGDYCDYEVRKAIIDWYL